jgi:hypothetical protein
MNLIECIGEYGYSACSVMPNKVASTKRYIAFALFFRSLGPGLGIVAGNELIAEI